jgi:hypothetical protein
MKGSFPFMQDVPGVKIPIYAPEIGILPGEIQQLFGRAFIQGYREPGLRPSPVDWHGALQRLRSNLKQCEWVEYHQLYDGLTLCPWCKIDSAFAQSARAGQAPVLTQTRIPSSKSKPISPPTPQKKADDPQGVLGYNANGNQTKKTQHNADGTREERIFDAKGNRVKYVAYNPSGSVTHWNECEYDANDNLVKETFRNPDGTVSFWNKYKYNSIGKLDRLTNYTAVGSIHYWYEHQYDAHGNLLKRTQCRPDGSRYEFEFDADGKIIHGIVTE